MMDRIINAWRKSFSDKNFTIRFLIVIPLLPLILFLLTRFLNFVEARQGAVFSDPLLALFNPIDLTWLTFALIYGGMTAAIISLLPYPAALLTAVQTYILMVLFRMTAMYLLPLEPPPSTIVLSDPIVEIFGTSRLLTKDLFFSGHTATLFIFFLTAVNKRLKGILLALTIIVGCGVLIQHVHYSIDVFAAPFISYASYRIIITIDSFLINASK